MRRLLLVLLAAAAIPVRAQLVETIEVRVTNVDVVVTDSKGNPVPGLTMEDFEVRENGRPQKITNFYEVTAAAPAAVAGDPSAPPLERRQRRVIVFVDNFSIEPKRRNDVFESIYRALDDLMREGDEVMLAIWNRRLETMHALTASRDDIRNAMYQASQRTGGGSFLLAEKERIVQNAQELRAFARANPRLMRMDDAYREATSAATSYAENIFGIQRSMLAGLEKLITMLAGVDGRKVLLYVGGNLEENPGLESFQSVDAVFIPEGVVRGTARLRENRQMGPYLESLGKRANADGVTMYMIDTGDRSGRMREAGQSDIGDSEAEFTAMSTTLVAMGALATMTGGSVMSGTRNFKASLDVITRDLAAYYSLGYRSDLTGNDTRNIAVRVKRPNVRVRARRSYTPKSADDEMRERVLANAFHDVKNEMRVSVEAGKTEPHPNGVKVHLTVTFPSDMTLLPQGEDLVGEFSVYVVVANPVGDTSSVGRDIQKIRIPANVAAAVRQKPFVYTSAVVVRKGEQAISVGIRDLVSGRSGFAKTTVVTQ
jgi:VWFA-related protein